MLQAFINMHPLWLSSFCTGDRSYLISPWLFPLYSIPPRKDWLLQVIIVGGEPLPSCTMRPALQLSAEVFLSVLYFTCHSLSSSSCYYSRSPVSFFPSVSGVPFSSLTHSHDEIRANLSTAIRKSHDHTASSVWKERKKNLVMPSCNKVFLCKTLEW